MDIEGLKGEYIGQELLMIIDVNLGDERVTSALKMMTGVDYSEIDSAKLLLFENNRALIFVDFDCDGCRSGDWYLIHIRDILDKGQTTGIKKINSVIRDIEYVDYTDIATVIIVTDKYLIKMGQDNTDTYYPSNFFNIEECKNVALLGLGDYEVVKLE